LSFPAEICGLTISAISSKCVSKNSFREFLVRVAPLQQRGNLDFALTTLVP
jgi:hypothetical protein